MKIVASFVLHRATMPRRRDSLRANARGTERRGSLAFHLGGRRENARRSPISARERARDVRSSTRTMTAAEVRQSVSSLYSCDLYSLFGCGDRAGNPER